MREWAKQQGCWHAFKSRQLEYREHLDEIRVSIEDAHTNVRNAPSDKSIASSTAPSMASASFNMSSRFSCPV